MKRAEPFYWQRWGLGANSRLWIGGNDLEARAAIEAIVGSLRATPRTTLDGAFIAPKTPQEATYFAEKISPRLAPGALIWVAWVRSDREGLGRLTAELSAAGLDELDRVVLSDRLVTVGVQYRK